VIPSPPCDLKSSLRMDLASIFGNRLRENEPLARFTASRIGGAADVFAEARSAKELEQAFRYCWREGIPCTILGGGSNVLISDRGVRGLVILNRARKVRFLDNEQPVKVIAESGANLGLIARYAAKRGLSGLEWAAGIPGTLGGAVIGNAGAHGSDMSMNLILAEILHRFDIELDSSPFLEEWPVEKLEYSYRQSTLNRHPGEFVVLNAVLKLEQSDIGTVQLKIEEFTAYRRRTQPSGASMGSMFKNPKGDHAGRLIEAAGLKGICIGDAQISPVHANFFLNLGRAKAQDIFDLIQMAKTEVREKFSVDLQLEIELVGQW